VEHRAEHEDVDVLDPADLLVEVAAPEASVEMQVVLLEPLRGDPTKRVGVISVRRDAASAD
jgi:hypothetical protein